MTSLMTSQGASWSPTSKQVLVWAPLLAFCLKKDWSCCSWFSSDLNNINMFTCQHVFQKTWTGTVCLSDAWMLTSRPQTGTDQLTNVRKSTTHPAVRTGVTSCQVNIQTNYSYTHHTYIETDTCLCVGM